MRDADFRTSRGKNPHKCRRRRTCKTSRWRLTAHASREADGLVLGVVRKRQPRGPATCPPLLLVSSPGAKASLSSQRAFAGRPAAGPSALGPASADSECRSRGCPQSPPARTARRLGSCNSRTWHSRRSPSVRTKASRRLGLLASLGALPLLRRSRWASFARRPPAATRVLRRARWAGRTSRRVGVGRSMASEDRI
jgi:hypothetical protein